MRASVCMCLVLPDVDLALIQVVLGEVIGRGAFGVTHEATWRGGVAAVKCIRVSNRNEVVSFLREVEILSLIRHANVLPMYGKFLLLLSSGYSFSTHLRLPQSMTFTITWSFYVSHWSQLPEVQPT